MRVAAAFRHVLAVFLPALGDIAHRVRAVKQRFEIPYQLGGRLPLFRLVNVLRFNPVLVHHNKFIMTVDRVVPIELMVCFCGLVAVIQCHFDERPGSDACTRKRVPFALTFARMIPL